MANQSINQSINHTAASRNAGSTLKFPVFSGWKKTVPVRRPRHHLRRFPSGERAVFRHNDGAHRECHSWWPSRTRSSGTVDEPRQTWSRAAQSWPCVPLTSGWTSAVCRKDVIWWWIFWHVRTRSAPHRRGCSKYRGRFSTTADG